MMQHTPGAWSEDKDGSVAIKIRTPYGRIDTDEAFTVWAPDDGGRRCIAVCPGDDKEAAMNARLIAQAPAMRDLLQRIADSPCDHGAAAFCPRNEAYALLKTLWPASDHIGEPNKMVTEPRP